MAIYFSCDLLRIEVPDGVEQGRTKKKEDGEYGHNGMNVP